MDWSGFSPGGCAKAMTIFLPCKRSAPTVQFPALSPTPPPPHRHSPIIVRLPLSRHSYHPPLSIPSGVIEDSLVQHPPSRTNRPISARTSTTPPPPPSTFTTSYRVPRPFPQASSTPGTLAIKTLVNCHSTRAYAHYGTSNQPTNQPAIATPECTYLLPTT